MDNKKVYIVSSGSYSDYAILRCFLNKQKAIEYISVCDNGDLNDLEEFDIDDNIEITPIKYIRVRYYFNESYYGYYGNKYNFSIEVTNKLENNIDDIKMTYYYQDSMVLQRVILSSKYDENKLKNKYEKVCQELESHIDSLMKLEGWTQSMIEEWLNNKQKIIPESE